MDEDPMVQQELAKQRCGETLTHAYRLRNAEIMFPYIQRTENDLEYLEQSFTLGVKALERQVGAKL